MIISIIAFVAIGILADIAIQYGKLKDVNQSPLGLRTFDGSNSPYHPSVKYFPEAWNGYHYWMAETPFYPYSKPYRDRNECPEIHVSDDGMHWKGIDANPIDNFGEKGEKNLDYFSDPHILMHGDTMECWYRLTKRKGDVKNKDNVYIYRKQSVDGQTWSDRDLIMACPEYQEKEIVSPAVIIEDVVYNMWCVDNDKVFLYQSADAHKWDRQQCVLEGHNTKPWHLDVFKDGDTLLMVCYGDKELTLWESTDGILFSYTKTLLQPSHVCGSFYQHDLYRSSLVKIEKNHYLLYFSADNFEQTFIGVMKGISPMDLHVISVDGEKFSNFGLFIQNYFRSRYRSIHFMLTHLK